MTLGTAKLRASSVPGGSKRPPPATACSIRGDVFSAACPSRAVLELLAEKWALLLIDELASGPRRTAELRRRIGGISEKMLIQSLRRLERSGFIGRLAYPEVPPRVEYRLTQLGASLSKTVRAFDNWVERNLAAVVAAEHAFDARRPVSRPKTK